VQVQVQLFIDTLAAQRPNNLIKQKKGLKHENNTINRNEHNTMNLNRNEQKGQAHSLAVTGWNLVMI